jgi:hypothetical protein
LKQIGSSNVGRAGAARAVKQALRPVCKYAPNIDPTSSSAHPVDIVQIFHMAEEPAPAFVATPYEAQKTVLD